MGVRISIQYLLVLFFTFLFLGTSFSYGITWYSLASGDWDDPAIWTLDPSGALPNNPDNYTPSTSPTSTSDYVVILSGRTISVSSNNKTNARLTVEGRVDFRATTGHAFTEIKGSGKIILKADNFPAGDATHFITKDQGEGTVVFDSTGYDLATAHTFYHVEIDLDNSTDVLTLLADYQINGNLTITQGEFRINDNTSTILLDLIVDGNVNITANASVSVGTANAYDGGQNYYNRFHDFYVGGDFVSYGLVHLTNQTLPNYTTRTTTGAVTLHFTNASDNYFKLYNTTDLYNLHINKGTDNTYELSIYVHDKAYFALFGPNNSTYTTTVANPQHDKAFWIETGSVRLKGEVVIPSLGEGGNDWSVGENARLILDGENVEVYSTADNNTVWTGFSHAQPAYNNGASNQGIYIYGIIQVENGYLSTSNSAGLVYRPEASGSVQIEGGEVDINQLRLTGSASSGYYSYVQTGGIFRVNGKGQISDAAALLSLNDADMYFKMSGGQLIVEGQTAYTYGSIDIQCSTGNYNVTGGDIICDWDGTSEIYSTASFYNLEVTRDDSVSLQHALVVLNDITLDSASYFRTNGNDLSIGRNFSIDYISTFEHDNNITIFNGTEDGDLYIGYPVENSDYEQLFYNITIDKPAGTSLTVTGDLEKTTQFQEDNGYAEYMNRLVQIENTLTIESGILNQGEHSVRLMGPVNVMKDGQCGVYIPGTTHINSLIMLRDVDGNITTEDGAIFGNIKVNTFPYTNIITFSSDVYIKRISYQFGRINLQSHDLKVDYLHEHATTNNYDISSGSATIEMFYSDGNSSDGGLSILVTQNGTYGFPLGVLGKYTPAEVIVTNYSDDGYITIRPNDGELLTTDPGGGDILTYYWRVGHSDFGSVPTVEYNFVYDQSDVVGNENQYVPGYVLDEDPYTRHSDGNSSGVNTSTNTINFDNGGSGFTLGKVNYTAGRVNRFNGALDMYYSESTGSFNWSNSSAWHRSTPTGPNFVPTDGSIVKIMGDARINVQVGSIATLAMLEFEQTNTSPTSENVGRLQFHVNGTYDLGTVRDTGMISFNATRTINVSADFGDFGSNPESYYLYFGGDATLNNIPEPIPNLMMESADYTIDQNIDVNGNLIIQGDADVTPAQDIHINNDLIIGFWSGGTFHFPGTGSPIEITVDGNIDFTQDPFSYPQDRNIVVDDPGSSSTLEHTLILKGDIIHGAGNGYDIDLFNASNRPAVILELQGENNNSYYRTSTSVPDFYRVVMNKGSDQDSTFTFSDDFTLSGPTSGAGVLKALELQNGTLILDDPDIDIDLSSGDDDFEIPSTACLKISQGTANVYGDDNGIWLDGKLWINGGTLDMINGAGNGNNYIEYTASGSSEIQVDGGSLLVGSQVRRNIITLDGILTFSQNSSSSTVTIGENAAPENRRGVFEILSSGSSFTQVADANITIVRSQTTPAAPTLYFDPETSNIGSGASITFGNASTPASQNMGIYSTINVQNIVVDNSSGNNPTVSEWVLPLTINEALTIQSGTEFDANGLDLTLLGDLFNSGTFTPNGNTTYLSGSNNQRVVGNTTFYNLTKTSASELWLAESNAAITIAHDFDFQAGIIRDSSNTITVQGDCNFDGTHIHGAQSGEGIYFNGTSEQELTGSGIFGKMSINNANGVKVPLGNNLTITDTLKLTSGVFWVGKNLLTLTVDAVIEEDNPFSTTNMIQTNVSFTDYGVRKYLPSGAKTFVYPIGSGGKYTPVTLDITANASSTGYITVKAADEMHPSIQEDSETPDPEITDASNVLQYHWLMRASGISGFSATADMKYSPADVEVTSPYDVYDYITARLLNDGSGQWNKYDDVDKFDETSEILIFDFSGVSDDEISGDYTAGVDGSSFNGAIPDEVPTYETNSTGDWTTSTIWTPNVSGGPRGAITKINVTDTVTSSTNYISSYATEILGTVLINTTFGHRFGEVTGNGLLYSEREVIPAGIYDEFFSSAGGTLEYGGNADLNVLAEISLVNNLKFSGTGERQLPSENITLNGDLDINGGAALSVENGNDIDIDIKGDLIHVNGTFDAGVDLDNLISFTSTVSQTVSGDFSDDNAINSFKVNNPNGITISSGVVDITGTLYLTNGTITTSSTDTLRVGITSSISPSNGSSSSYINGPLTKVMSSGDDFTFPVGKSVGSGLIDINNITGITGVNTDVSVEYFFSNPRTDFGSGMGSGVNTVSVSEYWSIDPIGGAQSTIEIYLDGSSDVANALSDINDLIMVGWSGTQWEQVGGTYTITGDAMSGSISCNSNINYSTYQYITLGSTQTITIITASIVSGDASICNGETATITIALTGGTTPWEVQYTDGISTFTESGINTSPHDITVSPSSTTTYTLTSVEDDIPINGILVGDTNTVITVNALPTITFTNNSTGDEICGGDEVIFTAGGGSNYDFHLNGTSDQSGTSTTYTTSTLADQDDVFVVVTNSNGCSDTSSTTTITVYQPPTVDAGSNEEICAGSTMNLSTGTTVPSESNTASLSWATSGTGTFNNNTLLQPIYTPSAADETTGAVTLTLTGNGNGSCASVNDGMTLAINPTPTITLGSNPSVCSGTTTANLTYSATTGSPDEYSIDFDATAEGAGFSDVTGASLPASPVVITVPGGAANGTYNANLTVTNSTSGCVSGSYAITVTVNSAPTITLGSNPSVCSGTTTANLTFSGTTGSPDEYSIDFDATAEGAGFSDVSGVSLPASPVVITVPGGAANGTYNANLTVTNSTTGCVSGNYAITVTVNALPVPTISGSDTICQGTTVIYTTESGKTNYNWTVSDIDPSASHTIDAGGGATDNTITVTWDGYEGHGVSVNYDDANGCSAASSTELDIWVVKLTEIGPAYHVPNTP
jgi:hypothetical protein